MSRLGLVGLAGLVFAACAPRGGTEVQGPPGDTGAEAEQALAIARECSSKESWLVMNDGYGLAIQQATAHRDPSSGGRFRVRIPEGFYYGRLQAPRPPGVVWIQVDLASKSCSPATAP